MKTELEIIQDFYDEVCKRAEAKMIATGKLEGSHYAAMREVLEEKKKELK